MMRRMFSVGLAAVLALCVAGTASAATSVDLVFVGSGTSVTDITPGFSGTVAARVLLTSDDGLVVGSTSVQWDNASTLAVAGTAEWIGIAVAFNMMTSAATATMNPAIPGPAGAFIDNPNRKVYAFDGLIAPPNNPPNMPATTYQVGTVVWSTTGAAGNTNINAFLQFGIDGFYNPFEVIGTFGTATINVVPEPGTASLLGLGLIGLIMAGRRNRA